VEQRLAVHARGDTEAVTGVAGSGGDVAALQGRRRFSRGAWLAIVGAALSVASVADAKPKRRDSKASFDKGVAAYKKHNFAAASDALSRSFQLERDPDTLFAWAQAQRQLSNFSKAAELYDMLLSFDLPAKNRAAVEQQLAECLEAVAAQQPKVPQQPKVVALPDDPVEPNVVTPAPPPPEPPVQAPAPAPVVVLPSTRPWYKDPVAIGLLGGGLVITAAGGGVLLSAWSLDRDSKAAFASNQYDRAQDLADTAKSRERIGVVTMGVGGVLVVGGAVWIATHRGGGQERVVTGWLAPGGGGLAVAGAF
jgi:tetratricopeptide (TPR) repeat protein